MRPHEMLQQFWAGSCKDLVSNNNTEADVIGVETRYEIRFPKDFRDYLLYGMTTGRDGLDLHDSSWWSLAELKNLPEENEYEITNPMLAKTAKQSVFFADYLIWCWAWAINCAEGENYGRIFVVSDDERIVADSFSEFVERYINDVYNVS